MCVHACVCGSDLYRICVHACTPQCRRACRGRSSPQTTGPLPSRAAKAERAPRVGCGRGRPGRRGQRRSARTCHSKRGQRGTLKAQGLARCVGRRAQCARRCVDGARLLQDEAHAQRVAGILLKLRRHGDVDRARVLLKQVLARAMAMIFLAWLMAAGPVATMAGGWPLADSRTTWQTALAIEFNFESPLTLSRRLSEAAAEGSRQGGRAVM